MRKSDMLLVAAYVLLASKQSKQAVNVVKSALRGYLVKRGLLEENTHSKDFKMQVHKGLVKDCKRGVKE